MLKIGLLDLFIQGYELHRINREDKFKVRENENLRNILLEMLSKSCTIVILEDGSIIGYASYKIAQKLTKSLWIDEIVINENFSDNGYGKRVLNYIEKIAEAKECDSIELSCWSFNKRALEIYEHLGFKEQKVILEKKISKKSKRSES